MPSTHPRQPISWRPPLDLEQRFKARAAAEQRPVNQLLCEAATLHLDLAMAAPEDKEIVTLLISKRVADLLRILTNDQVGPATLRGVIEELIDHAQQGVYRPGAWERGWLISVFSDEWIDKLVPDHEKKTSDERFPFMRPRRQEDVS
jgi:hypothetical protein